MRARPRPLRALRCLRRWSGALIALGAGWCGSAQALIVTVTDTGSFAISLRVGSAAAIDNVSFNVAGPSVGTSTPVTGTPSVAVSVTPVRPSASGTARPVKLTVDSSAQLACQPASGCGSTTIPFSKISWTVTNNSGVGSGDIQNGVFNGTATQQIATFNANAGSSFFPFCPGLLTLTCIFTNQLSATSMAFSYANDTIYPAGIYRGRVIFTATME